MLTVRGNSRSYALYTRKGRTWACVYECDSLTTIHKIMMKCGIEVYLVARQPNGSPILMVRHEG